MCSLWNSWPSRLAIWFKCIPQAWNIIYIRWLLISVNCTSTFNQCSYSQWVIAHIASYHTIILWSMMYWNGPDVCFNIEMLAHMHDLQYLGHPWIVNEFQWCHDGHGHLWKKQQKKRLLTTYSGSQILVPIAWATMYTLGKPMLPPKVHVHGALQTAVLIRSISTAEKDLSWYFVVKGESSGIPANVRLGQFTVI